MVASKAARTKATAKRGRPGGRAAQVIAAVHGAALSLLEEKGYENLTIPDIATRAEVNKTTIYRRWPGKAELILDVALTRMRADVPMPDTGDLGRDLSALLRSIAAAMATPFSQGLLRAIMSLGPEEAALYKPGRFWDQRFFDNAELVERAIERGEIGADTDPRQLLEMAVAPLFFRALILGRPLSKKEINALADRVVLAFQ